MVVCFCCVYGCVCFCRDVQNMMGGAGHVCGCCIVFFCVFGVLGVFFRAMLSLCVCV